MSAAARPARARAEGVPHLVFTAGGGDYALPLLAVRQIVRLEDVERVPGAPPALRGVMRTGGEAVAVVDLGAAFGEPSPEDTFESSVLLLASGGAEMSPGLLVDGVRRIVPLTAGDLVPTPRLATLFEADFVAALVHVDRDLLPLLDPDRLMALEDVRAALHAARSTAGGSR